MNLNSQFAPSTNHEWKEKIVKDLKGGQLEDLIWQSELGHIDPVLFSYKNKYERVDAHQNQEDNSWNIAHSFDCSDPKNANAQILEGLQGGINCIKLLNLQPQNLREVLEGVMLEIIETKCYIEPNQVLEFEKVLSNILKERNIESTVVFELLLDPIGCYITGHKNEIEYANGNYIVRTSVFESAGGSIQHELGFAVSQGHEYLLQLINLGNSPVEAARKIQFEVAVGNSYFPNIAKIRALRTLWNTVLNNYEIDFKDVTINAVTSKLYQSNLDLHNNLLRGSTGAMSAIIAGVSSLEVTPYDIHLDDKQSDAMRLSKNISLLLQEEAYFHQVKNAANGSYYIEQLTDIIIEKSWSVFQRTENKGGFLKHFEMGKIQDYIQIDLGDKIKAYKESELVLVGSNKFPNSEDPYSEDYCTPLNSKFITPFRLAQIKIEA